MITRLKKYQLFFSVLFGTIVGLIATQDNHQPWTVNAIHFAIISALYIQLIRSYYFTNLMGYYPNSHWPVQTTFIFLIARLVGTSITYVHFTPDGWYMATLLLKLFKNLGLSCALMAIGFIIAMFEAGKIPIEYKP